MSYYYSKQFSLPFDEIIVKVTDSLKEQGFGIITQINVKETFKKKLDVDFKKYQILGACNPSFAYKALQFEDKIGTMLPCNVVVQESANGMVEVVAINPIASMQAVNNPALEDLALQIKENLTNAIDNI